MSVLPKKRRPDQNTGRRAKTVSEVESQPCGNGPHELTNDSAANTYCAHCGEWWWVLDGRINGRAS